MAEAVLVLRGEGATIHGKANRRAGEHQGAWGKLTVLILVEERGWRGLSTERAFGAAAGNVEGLRWCPVSPGGAQNRFVGVRGSYGCGELGNRAAVCSNCSDEEQ